MNKISRYGLEAEIPREVEEQGPEAVEACASAKLDAECQRVFRVPLARLDDEVRAAVATVPTPTEEEVLVDPVGASNRREAAMKAAVDAVLERATARAQSLTPVAADAVGANDDDEETGR